VPDLEEQLAALGREVAWPLTPSLAAGVRSRITVQPQVHRAPWFQSRWALAAAALIIVAAALLAYNPTREAIADWINVHVFFQRVNVLPTPSPQPPGPLGERLGLGGRSTLAGAQQQVKWHIAIPASLGSPDEVYLQLPPAGAPLGEVTLVYSTRPGIPVSGETGVAVLITSARGGISDQFFGKMLGPGTTLEAVTVGGHRGFWVAGSPHMFVFLDAEGVVRGETMRLATNTLILDEGGTVVRIEGNLTKAQAMEIAASLG
jgi:hypothetical protein